MNDKEYISIIIILFVVATFFIILYFTTKNSNKTVDNNNNKNEKVIEQEQDDIIIEQEQDDIIMEQEQDDIIMEQEQDDIIMEQEQDDIIIEQKKEPKVLSFEEYLRKIGVGIGGDVLTSGEIWVFDKVKTIDKNELIVFDVGSNVGLYTQSIIDHVPQKSQIHCFEPVKSTFEILKAAHSDKKNVILNNIGLSDKPGELQIYTFQNESGELSGLSSVHKRELDFLNIETMDGQTIKVDTLDNYCQINNIHHIDLLKLDVEGHELSVFKGATNIIKKCKYIQFEFGGCNIDSRTYFKDFWNLFKPYNANIYRIATDKLIPITQYSELLEQFITTNYFVEIPQ